MSLTDSNEQLLATCLIPGECIDNSKSGMLARVLCYAPTVCDYLPNFSLNHSVILVFGISYLAITRGQ